MGTNHPSLLVLGGPNGAGKTTISRAVLADTLGLAEFVNADVIAQGLSGFDPEAAALQAGRVMLTRLRELAAARADSASEATLASRTFAPWLAGLRRDAGYRVHVILVYLRSPELAVQRMHARVRRGGHSVPPGTVRRRYARGIANFINLYLPIADAWQVYDNSTPGGIRIVASGFVDETPTIDGPAVWERLLAIARRQDDQTITDIFRERTMLIAAARRATRAAAKAPAPAKRTPRSKPAKPAKPSSRRAA